MRVLGIDPSLQSTGFGVVEETGTGYLPVVYGIVKPSPKLPFPSRLNEIRTELEKVMTSFAPDEVAIENAFYAQNIRTALSLGQVRGAVLVAVAAQSRELFEYSALEIKKAVTGYGQADKNQVRVMVKTLLNIEDDALSLDASDALAAAICHLNSRIFQKKLEESFG
ncbi:crossover junction endodeoxyribonuclease RuvC [bacterium]|nr:MAG: crossover junction endodeoxyribonuclease RuvC [bacterium]